MDSNMFYCITVSPVSNSKKVSNGTEVGNPEPYMVWNPSDLGNSCNLSARPSREVA